MQKTKEYIKQHRNDDVYKLALGKAPEGVDLQYALQQIAAYQTIEKKIPSWAECDELIFPRQLSLEQSSSELTARYKASLIKEFMGNQPFTHIDLTGGMGIDCYFIAQHTKNSHYVELNPELCQIAQHNFTHLNPNISVHNTTAEEFLNILSPCLRGTSPTGGGGLSTLNSQLSTLIYLDPARRGDHGQKLVSIADCQPNVVELLPQMFELTNKIVVKLSPMLDITRAISELPHIEKLYVISVGNECKELLLFINKNYTDDTQICAINLNSQQITKTMDAQYCPPVLGGRAVGGGGQNSQLSTLNFCDKREQSSLLRLPSEAIFSINERNRNLFIFPSEEKILLKKITTEGSNSQLLTGTLSNEASLTISHAHAVCKYLYEPYAAHLKSGLYKTIAQQYGCEKLHQHSHLYTSTELNLDFPGRRFEVKEVVPFDKKSAKALFKSLPKANLTTRNFPLTVSELRTQYKIKDGGETYIFATTLYDESKVLIVCHKA